MIQLALVPAVKVSPCVLKVTDLTLNLVQVLAHLAGVSIMGSRDLVEASFELLLGVSMQQTSVLHVFKLPFDRLVFGSLPRVGLLLLVKVVAPLCLHLFELTCYLLAECLQLLKELDRHSHCLFLEELCRYNRH